MRNRVSKNVLSLLFVCGLFQASGFAITYNEMGDTGELLGTAQDVGPGIDLISGVLPDISDHDLYRLFLPAGTFTASTVGLAKFDTNLWLFESAGLGVLAADDDFGSNQTVLTATLTQGIYYLAITANTAVPPTVPSSAAGTIWGTHDGLGRNTGVPPFGPGLGSPLSSWSTDTRPFDLGPYGISLSVQTIVPEPGADFDNDGDVDGDDFLAWQSGFGINMNARHADGDADGDGDVDGDDFLTWQGKFGSGRGAASAVVPEPSSFALGLS